MTPADLRRIGAALYGPRWRQPLATALGVALRTLQRWDRGERGIPDGLSAELSLLSATRVNEIQRAWAKMAKMKVR